MSIGVLLGGHKYEIMGDNGLDHITSIREFAEPTALRDFSIKNMALSRAMFEELDNDENGRR